MGPIDVLDHSSRAFTYGSKMGIDATRKWPEEGFSRSWPPVIQMDAATRARVDAMWPALGLDPGRRVEDERSAARMTGRDGQTLARASRWISYVNFVKLPHTVFMLPFGDGRCDAGELRRDGYDCQAPLDRVGIYQRALCGNGIQSHR